MDRGEDSLALAVTDDRSDGDTIAEPSGSVRPASRLPLRADEDYFALFGLAPTYDLDLEELERRYLERSRDVHPDRFVQEGAAKRVAALQKSMQLNEAYRTLRRPVARAEYLLGLRGIAIGPNEQLSCKFLTDVLEAREELLDAKLDGDDDKLDELRSDMVQKRGAAMTNIGSLFTQVEVSTPEAHRSELLCCVKQELIMLRYVDRYLEELEEADD